MYDPVIGRWMRTDPAGQFNSPYEGMGNNPVSGTDPTGGEADWHRDWAGNLVADAGDNASTLATYLGTSLDNANSIISNYGNWDGGNSGGITLDNIGGHTLTGGFGDISAVSSPMNVGGLGLADVEGASMASSPFGPAEVDYGSYNVSSGALRDRLDQFSHFIPAHIQITSGDRSRARNTAAGGANASRHLFGDAADMKVNGISNIDLAHLASESRLFNTVIHYPAISAPGALHPHVHVDLNAVHHNLFLIYTPTITNGVVTHNGYSQTPN